MSSGRPDWNSITVMSGKYGTDFLPVLLDALGQLYVLMRGDYGGTPTTLALDSAGRILAHLIGLDGSTPRDVALDASGNLNARLKGLDGSTLRDVAVDSTGQIMALLRGIYGSTLKTIAVDTDGIMKANLAAQDFDFLRVRPVYGEARALISNPVSIESHTTGTLGSATGRGATYRGVVYWTQAESNTGNIMKLIIDGTEVFSMDMAQMATYGLDKEWVAPFKLIYTTAGNAIFIIGLDRDITFEASLSWTLYNATGNLIVPYRYFYYSLVPA
jgi:hypothetical protein